MNRPTVLAIVGSTGSGKSALALALAERCNGEIISCDSMQVYRRMDIGTAKPSLEEQRRVRHHMIDMVDPHEPFSCAEYVPPAAAAVEDCAARGKLPIICGGTGLYLDALLRKNDFMSFPANEDLRAELHELARQKGVQVVWEKLKAVDPESAATIHPNNVKRVIRALEIWQTCGMTKTELDRRSREGGLRYRACTVGLRYSDREALYHRIDRRVDQMLKMGLAEETQALMEEGVFEKNQTAAQAIGYKELLPYCRGEIGLAEAASAVKTATRRYAKRQITWFSAKSDIVWTDIADPNFPQNEKTFEEIVNNVKELFQNFQKCDKIIL